MLDQLAQRARGVRQSDIRAVTRRIEARGGVNLGQGTCALPTDPRVLDAAHRAMDAGKNSYTLFDGIPALRSAVAARYGAYNALRIEPENVLVTGGATGAFECVCKAFLEPGDRVVLVEPVYGYHLRQVVERAAVPSYVRLHAPGWTLDMGELEAELAKGPKLLVFSNPNNPSGKVFTRAELTAIGELCRAYGVIAVVDEVYEYIMGEGAEHVSLASLPGMFDHTLTLSSASKTLFVTGWRVGWLVGPADVLQPLGVKSDETYVCAPSPFQHAVAEAYAGDDAFFRSIRTPFQAKATRLAEALRGAGFKPQVPMGAYYMLADYQELGHGSDAEAMGALVDGVGIGSIPGSAFYLSGADTGMLRFCFAVVDAELDRACELLAG